MNKNTFILLIGGIISFSLHICTAPDFVSIIPLGLALLIYFLIEST